MTGYAVQQDRGRLTVAIASRQARGRAVGGGRQSVRRGRRSIRRGGRRSVRVRRTGGIYWSVTTVACIGSCKVTAATAAAAVTEPWVERHIGGRIMLKRKTFVFQSLYGKLLAMQIELNVCFYLAHKMYRFTLATFWHCSVLTGWQLV